MVLDQRQRSTHFTKSFNNKFILLKSSFKTKGGNRILIEWNTEYGNSNFGHWVTDPYGLPAFKYTCKQETEPRAQYNTSLGLKRNHWHQLGNDRVVALGFNDGYIQIWNSERTPLWLNYYQPDEGHFTGGFGYLYDGSKHWSTLYLDRPEDSTYERLFGMGYYQKKMKYAGLQIVQTVFAPFGNDSLLISQVQIKNESSQPKNLRYFEYWDANIIELKRPGSPEKSPTLERHLVQSTTYDPEVKVLIANPIYSAASAETSQKMFAEPQVLFLAALDAPVDSYDTDKKVFFGDQERANSIRVASGSCTGSVLSTSSGSEDACFVIQSNIHLPPKGEKTLYYAFGYAEGDLVEALVEKYRNSCRGSLESTMDSWKNGIPIFNAPRDTWITRELAWDYYYLRSGATYDEFFKAHIISQGYIYQYVLGWNGAARDPLQHAMPMVYLYPELAREVLRYTMKEATPDGEIPYCIYPPGIWWGEFLPSDSDLWLLWLATEYVLATRDFSFLDEVLPYYEVNGEIIEATVYQHLKTAYKHLINVVGLGPHGLIKVKGCDWNDLIIRTLPLLGHDDKKEAAFLNGESVLNTAMATYILPYFAELAEAKGDKDFAAQVRKKAEQQKEALSKQWTGRWFLRCWLGEGTPLGSDELWLEPQPWVLIGGSTTLEQARTLIENLYRILDEKSSIGAALKDPPLDFMPGVWYALNGPLVWGYSLYNKNLAWREYINNTLAKHAETYPDIWIGVWSGADCYYTWLFPEEQGLTFAHDFPIMNMHSHAQPLYATLKLSGIQPTKDGLTIDPKTPFEEFSIKTETIGLTYSREGVEGHVKALGDETVTIKVKLPTSLRGRGLKVVVNSILSEHRVEDGFVLFTMKLIRGEKTNWKIAGLTNDI